MNSSYDEQLQAAKRASRWNAAVSGMGGAILLGSLVFSAVAIRTEKKEVESLQSRAKALKDSIAARESTLARMAPVAARGLGYVAWRSVEQAGELRPSLDARKALDSLTRLNAVDRSRFTVHYFGADLSTAVNTAIVEPELKRLGFRVERRMRDEGMADVPTNCIWFGKNVQTTDVRLIALLLTSAGVDIRCIRPFQNAAGPKANSVEIGGRRSSVTEPIWSVDRILTATFDVR